MIQLHTSSAKYGVMFVHTAVEAGYSPLRGEVKIKAHTTCTLYKRNSQNRWEQVVEGVAKYNDDKDAFSFYQGRKHALAEAIKQLEVPKKTKAEMWDSYLRLVGLPLTQVEISDLAKEKK